MRSFGQLVSDAQKLGRDTSSSWKTFFQNHMNETEELILGMETWPFNETTQTITTQASTADYELDVRTGKVLHVRLSNVEGRDPTPIDDPNRWEYLQSLGASASDVPEHWRVVDNTLSFWPAISSASLTATVRYLKKHVDMSQDDYATGTITTLAAAGTAVTGSGSSWSANARAGQFFRITPPTGDGRWYKIQSVGGNTSLTLAQNYRGTAISAGSATYAIGDMPLIPAAYQSLLLYRPLALFFEATSPKEAKRWWMLYDGGHEAGLIPYDAPIGGLLGNMLARAGDVSDGPYISPDDNTMRRNINDPPSNLTGF